MEYTNNTSYCGRKKWNGQGFLSPSTLRGFVIRSTEEIKYLKVLGTCKMDSIIIQKKELDRFGKKGWSRRVWKDLR